MSAPEQEFDDSTWARRTRPALRHVKRSELLARQIVEEILSRRLKPGDLLPSESVMLAHYEVGRASLREALRILETQGLVSLKPGPGGGPVVGAVDPTNLGRTASLYFRADGTTYRLLAEAMLILDPWLAELAAERSDPARVSAELGACMEAADTAEGDPANVWKVGPEFHDSVYELSANGVLKTIASALGSIFRTHVLSEVELVEHQPRFLAEHHGISDAIHDHDPSLARRLAYEHMESIIAVAAQQKPGLLDRIIEWR